MKVKARSWFQGGLAALALAVAAGASADVNIGVIVSTTGPAASLGIPARNTVDLWPQEIAGQKIRVTVLDDASDTTAATRAARKLTQEEKVDVIVGPSITPTSLAVLQVAGETSTPTLSLAGGGAIIDPPEGPRRWVFKMPPSEEIQLGIIFDHMKKKGEKRLGIVGVSNAYGQVFIDVAQKLAQQHGIEIVNVERFNPTDASVVAQTVKMLGTSPDAVFIAAVGTPAAMPHVELKRRGFAGTIYQTQAIANNDFLRVGGKDVEGGVLPVSPLLVAEQLPQNDPIRPVAMSYVERYEGKYGPGTRAVFGGTAWDALILIEKALPQALQKGQPGTAEFRTALRDALETSKEVVLAQGVYSLSPTDHNGADQRSQVLVEIRDGAWRYIGN